MPRVGMNSTSAQRGQRVGSPAYSGFAWYSEPQAQRKWSIPERVGAGAGRGAGAGGGRRVSSPRDMPVSGAMSSKRGSGGAAAGSGDGGGSAAIGCGAAG